jgi:N-acetylglucosamine kinase-like BadF-type ATPase
VRLALAIDGGNSKTDAALVREDGAVLGLARGGGSSPHHLGAEAALDVIGALVDELAPSELPAEALMLLAGVDFPDEEHTLEELATQRAWAERTRVRNDTFAVLRAGTEQGWGVAVVCGAGINCLGLARDGRSARFPALGPITGDWGGGADLGEEALFAAARSEDGRGPRTMLEARVPEYFGLAAPSELAHAIHRRRISKQRLLELAPLVLDLAADDAVAAAIVDRLVSEIVALVRVASTRLRLEETVFDVVLGGGLLQRAAPPLVAAIAHGVHLTAPGAVVRPTAAPAIVGSALLILDELGADDAAKARARAELERESEIVTVGGQESDG